MIQAQQREDSVSLWRRRDGSRPGYLEGDLFAIWVMAITLTMVTGPELHGLRHNQILTVFALRCVYLQAATVPYAETFAPPAEMVQDQSCSS